MLNLVKQINRLADYFLPRFCFDCRTKLTPHELYICQKCFSLFKYTDKPRMEFEYNKKFTPEKLITTFNALYLFEIDTPIQTALHELKYKSMFRIGEFLGEELGKAYNSLIKELTIDFIIPIPLYKTKEVERGYNQSFYITKGIKKVTGLPVDKHLLKRVRDTQTQTHLNIEERKENMNGAFKVTDKDKIKCKKILLVDDVITTGATVNECAKVLLQNGAAEVHAMSTALAD